LNFAGSPEIGKLPTEQRTGRPSIYNLVSDPISNPDEWVERLKWLEDGFKAGARCYGSCLSTVAGAIFNLERGLNVPQDEDITHPEGFFRGMPTWDRVMALPYQDRMRAFRDPEVPKAMSAEAVEGTVAQEGGMTDRAAARAVCSTGAGTSSRCS
jgi:hypothetical protein